MSFLGKTYVHQRDENFKEFLDALGVPEELKSKALSSRSSQKFEKQGDEYVAISDDGQKVKETRFKSGVEFDENLFENFVTKTTITVDGDVVRHMRVAPDGRSLAAERRFSGDEMVLIVKANDAEGRRYYKAA